MATSGTYFLNGPTLSSSTAVFTDAALSICAPDGFYSDGSIVREQVGCVLLAEVICPSCATPCNTNISGAGGQGVYSIDSSTGTSTGAIIIRFQPFGVPDGILAQLGPTYYNGMSSQNYGWLQGTAGLPTYVGEALSDCGILAGSPYTGVAEFEYQGTGFVNLGTTTTVTVLAGQIDFTANPPGICTMVIPKTSNTYTTVSAQVIGLCPGTGFGIEIECPVALSSWTGSGVAASGNGACLLTPTTTYYYVHVNGSGGVLGLYDMVFADPNGETPLAAGYYNTGAMSASFDWVQVDANGVVISFGICSESTNYTVQRCYTNDLEIVSIPGTPAPGENVVLVEFPGCIWEVISTTILPATATFQTITTETCLFQCASWQVVNNNETLATFVYEDCENNLINFDLPSGQSVTVCGHEVVSIPPGFDVTIVDCECQSVPGIWELLGCCDNDVVVAIANVPVNPGDLVKVSDTPKFDCWYTVVGLSLANPTTTIITNNGGAFGCDEVCCSYTVQNVDVVANDVSFTQCDGVGIIITVPPSSSIDICARSGSITYTGTMNILFTQCSC